MANTQYLQVDANTNLRDQQHAARMFVDDSFRLAPKSKFLFHVAFSINSAALKSIDIVQRHRNEINMLVKSADLPSFAIKSETLNQYNRKKNVQITHSTNPINIKFHDDNMGLINQLWQNYYSYYYADSTSAQTAGAYNRNATKNFDFVKTPFGFDNKSSVPFFNYITLYQMARHEFVSYKLMNPIITSWNHNNMDYANGGLHDNSMQLQYEAVAYGSGKVTPGDPEGFALEHYDVSPSPLSMRGSLQSASPSFTNNTVTTNASSFVQNMSETINTYQNTQNLTNAGVSGGTLTSLSSIGSSLPGIAGLQGIAFPVVTTGGNANNATVATPVNLV